MARRGRLAQRGLGRQSTREEHHAFLRELRWRREDTTEMRERCRLLEWQNMRLERELQRMDRLMRGQRDQRDRLIRRVREMEMTLAQRELEEDSEEDPEEDPEEDSEGDP